MFRPNTYIIAKIELFILLKLNKLEEHQIQIPLGIASLN